MADWDGATERRVDTQRQQLEMLERLTKIESEACAIREKVEAIHKAIYGNGKEGLLVDQSRLKQTVGLFSWALGVIYVAGVGLALKRWLG